jgi:uncharacterized protein GlcG (DUF336 family)
MKKIGLFIAATTIALAYNAAPAAAQSGCPVSTETLRAKLKLAEQADGTGLNNHYWAVVVNRAGVVCAVAYSGSKVTDQWLLSRQIAAAKAFTSNGLSLNGGPVSTAMLYPWVQPGAAPNPLFGLAGGNPVDAEKAYAGSANLYGTSNDPMIGKRVGGTITFGGGLGLYSGSTAIGGLGLSGDTACADHSTAWRLRDLLLMEPPKNGLGFTGDEIKLGPADHPNCPLDGGTQGANPPA